MRVVFFVLILASTAFVDLATAQSSSDLHGQICIESPYAEYESEYCYDVLPGANINAFQDSGLPLDVGDISEDATSGNDGGYTLSLEDGDYDVTVSRQGFKDATRTVTVSGLTEENFILEPDTITIAGTVTDGEDPISGAVVEVYGRNYATATTASDGTYSVSTEAGYLSLRVAHNDFRPFDAWQLMDGSTFDVELEPLPPRDATVTGTVTDRDGQAVAGVTIRGSQWDYGDGTYGYSQATATSGSDGSYSLPAYSNTGISLEATKDGYTRASAWLQLESTSASQDFRVVALPDKDAAISGIVVNAVTGASVDGASVSIQYPEFGLYACSDGNRAYGDGGYGGTVEPESAPASSPPASGSSSSGGAAVEESMTSYPYEPEPCDITMDGGEFSGTVYPGYAIVSVWHDYWYSCQEGNCGPEYYSLTQVVQIVDGQSIRLELQPRASPDAVIQGYVLDADNNPVDAWVSFSNQDSYGWGNAETDQDGSYKASMRSGYIQVSVYAEGYLPWQGSVLLGADATYNLDIQLVEGEAYGYGCCYAHGGAMEDGELASPAEGAPSSPSSPSAPSAGGDETFNDLGGGLGPYSPARESTQGDGPSKGSPGVGLLLVVALAAAVALRRR